MVIPITKQEASAHTDATRLEMRAFAPADLVALYALYTDPAIQYLWSPGIEFDNLAQFSERLQRRMQHRWAYFQVFTYQQQIVGLAYCYNVSPPNQSAYLCICMNTEQLPRLYCLQAAYFYLDYLFKQQALRKLWAEVFRYNQPCWQLLQKTGWLQEGCLRDYQYWQQQYHDLLVLGLSQQQFVQQGQQRWRLLQRLQVSQAAIHN